MEGLKRGSAAIVGVAESDLGHVAEGLSVIDLMAQGVHRAIDDCGLKLRDVDALFSATTQSRLSVVALAEYLGLDPAYTGSTIVNAGVLSLAIANATPAATSGSNAAGVNTTTTPGSAASGRTSWRSSPVTGPSRGWSPSTRCPPCTAARPDPMPRRAVRSCGPSRAFLRTRT